ncbi:MAG TPA: type II secretion system secretin GspD, partial [bacterium]|nr:type II secretion system secretin GspD [bacterium]
VFNLSAAGEGDEEDVKVPLNLNNSRFKNLKKPVMPKLSKNLKSGNEKEESEDKEKDKDKDKSSLNTPSVKTVTPPKPKTALDNQSAVDGESSKLVDAVKIEVKDVKPVDPNLKIKLDFKDEDLINVVKLFSELKQKNFIIPENLGKTKVNIMAPQKVTVNEAYQTFLTLLSVNEFSVTEDGKFTIITREKSIPEMRIPFYKGTDVPDLFKMVATIIKFQYVTATDMEKVLKLFRDKSATAVIFDDKTLIVVDYAANIRKVKTLIAELDQPSESDSAKLFFLKLNHVAALDAKKILDDIFKDFSKKSSSKTKNATDNTPRLAGVSGPGMPPSSRAQVSQGDEETLSENVYLQMVADERSQQLIILCTQQTYNLIMEIVQNIDREVEGEGEIHVVKLQNAKAEDLVKTLTQVSKNKKAQGGTTAKTTKGTDVFEGEVQISADESTNSLVVVSSIEDFRNLKKVIEKLDIRRKQVFVEAAIMEVNVDDSLEYGNAYTGGGFEVSVGGEKMPIFFGKALDTSLTPGLVAGMVGPVISGTEGIPGLGLSGGIPSLGIILNAAQTDSAVNVMSTPHLLTTDNEEAEITVGETIPFPSGNIISGTAGSTITYTREDVALKLKIKPQINESGYMTLEINQEITELGAQTQYGFRTTKRQAKTIINAENEQTIVIGGLMKDSITESENKVPLLGDIPVLGVFFKYKRNVKKKVNLLIIITPHIIESKDDFARILKRKIEEREAFTKKFYGGSNISFEENIYLEKKRGALLSIVKEVDDTNRREEEEILRKKSTNAKEKTILVTPDGKSEQIKDENKEPDVSKESDKVIETVPEKPADGEDFLVPEIVPETGGE